MPILVTERPIDVGAIITALHAADARVGAIAAFVGTVRDVNAATHVNTLTLEHYPGMTEKTLAAIVDDACARWPLLAVDIVHRVGMLQPTDVIVVVAVASAHRGDAFAACEFIMDFLKTRAPFWKKEATPAGERWVEARASDDDAVARW